jgi:hypothetical protein
MPEPSSLFEANRIYIGHGMFRGRAAGAGDPADGEEAVPVDSGADTTVATARDGAGMRTTPVETVSETGSNGDGLRGLGRNGPKQGVPGGIMAWQRPDAASIEQRSACPSRDQ